MIVSDRAALRPVSLETRRAFGRRNVAFDVIAAKRGGTSEHLTAYLWRERAELPES